MSRRTVFGGGCSFSGVMQKCFSPMRKGSAEVDNAAPDPHLTENSDQTVHAILKESTEAFEHGDSNKTLHSTH